MATQPEAPDTSAMIHPPPRTTVGNILGAFHRVPQLPKLDHLLRFLSTWSGTDKALMLTQYGLKVVIALLRVAVVLRLRASGKVVPDSPAVALVPPLSKLSALCSDARVLYRIWGTLGIVQWMIGMEKTPAVNKTLQNIERLQGWSMLIYGPMEAAAYLAGHGILPISVPTQNKLWIHSCRLWAAYVILQIAHVAEQTRLWRSEARAVERQARSEKDAVAEKPESSVVRAKAALAKRKDALLTDFFVQLGYFPLTMHWSFETGFLSDTWVGIFGVIACAAGIRGTWAATA